MTAWTQHHLLPQLALPPVGYRPAPRHIDVWTLHAGPDSTNSAQRLVALLDPTERRCANSFLSTDRRDTYVLAHLALRLILANCLGTAPQAVPISHAACPVCQKPHGRTALRHVRNLHFSLSRSRTTVMLALARTPIGIGLKAVDSAGTELLHRLHPNEQEAIHQLPSAERSHALLECWVRKEAYLKAQETGLTRNRIPVVNIGSGPQLAADAGAPAGWYLSALTAPPGHAAAAAFRVDRHPASGQPTVTPRGCDLCWSWSAVPGV
ncbi:4'-phosphopantetheinyl transferase superfamily protein [Streptomyces sp. IB2014 016-6]|nr:4'-phosphopantetheinyl transferase superfamily protein [Streptomyces sp. IB2014 016-6]